MFGEKLTFEKKTLDSFAQLRDDMDTFRTSMNDWVMFLDVELKKSKEEIVELKGKISELETRSRFRF